MKQAEEEEASRQRYLDEAQEATKQMEKERQGVEAVKQVAEVEIAKLAKKWLPEKTKARRWQSESPQEV